MLDTSMVLPDGRTLAYTVCGDTSGPLVVYCHGAPTSRLDLAVLDVELARAGAQVVSPDRPGYGRSSPQPGRRLEDWAGDVAALADHLAATQLAVMGMSSGGPYAAVCAALLPGRVTAAAIVAGVTDMGWPPAWDGFLPGEAALMRLGDEAAIARWCEEHYGADGSRFLEGDAELAPADLAFLADEVLATGFVTSVSEAFRQGVAGYAQDVAVQGRPWDFDVRAVRARVRVLHGEADTLVPVAHARHTAELLPGSTLTTYPDDGHLSLLGRFPEIIADLAASLV